MIILVLQLIIKYYFKKVYIKKDKSFLKTININIIIVLLVLDYMYEHAFLT